METKTSVAAARLAVQHWLDNRCYYHLPLPHIEELVRELAEHDGRPSKIIATLENCREAARGKGA
jgi:hypothetical protein